MLSVSPSFVQEGLEGKQDKLSNAPAYSTPLDSDALCDVVLSDNKVKHITFANIWTWIKGKITSTFYPVGSIVLNMGTDPSSTFGGTWQLLATGTKALYLDSVAGTTVNEELPNIKGEYTLELTGNAGSNGAFKNTKEAGNRSPNWEGSNSWGKLKFDASKSNSVYKDNGKVRAEGITVCAWKRTA